MSSNGVDVPVEESVSDGNDELQKKTPYCNFFPKSCYQNVQFKQTKGGHIQAHLVSDVAMSTDKTVEDEVVNTSSPQPVNSPPSTDQFPRNTTTTTTTVAAVAATSTGSVSSTINTDVTSRTSSVTSTSALSNVSIPVAEAVVSKTPSAEIPPSASLEPAGQVVPSTTNDTTAVTTSSVSTSDITDGPVSTSDDAILTDDSSTKVNSAVIEVGDINPVYESWQTLKNKNDSKPVTIATTNNYETANFTMPKGTSAYDLMEPILKPSTYNSSVFLSAPSSVIDNQISEGSQPDAPSPMVYENVFAIGNGKFTVTPPSSCDSKENLDFPLESSPNEQQSSLNRSNSTGSMLPRPTVQHHATYHSPANNRRGNLKHSASLSASPQLTTLQQSNETSKSVSLSETDTNNDPKINVRGSTAISRGSVKKKINLFENTTLPPGVKSLAQLGIFEDQDSDNGFIV